MVGYSIKLQTFFPPRKHQLGAALLPR